MVGTNIEVSATDGYHGTARHRGPGGRGRGRGEFRVLGRERREGKVEKEGEKEDEGYCRVVGSES